MSIGKKSTLKGKCVQFHQIRLQNVAHVSMYYLEVLTEAECLTEQQFWIKMCHFLLCREISIGVSHYVHIVEDIGYQINNVIVKSRNIRIAILFKRALVLLKS